MELVGPPTCDDSTEAVDISGSTGVDAVDINDGLDSFQLVPKDGDGMSKLTGEALLDHMVRFLHTNTPLNEEVGMSEHVDVEVTADQQKYILNPKTEHYTARELASSAVGEGAKKKLAKRKMDVIGNIKSHCGTLNDEERIEELRKKSELAESLSFTSRMRNEAKKKKASDKAGEIKKLAPKAAKKLRDAGDVDKINLTINEMNSILIVCYLLDEVKGRKDAVKKALRNEYNKNPGAIDNVAGNVSVNSDSDDDDGSDDEAVVVVQRRSRRSRSTARSSSDEEDDDDDEEDEEEEDDEDEADYGEEHYQKRVAKYHVEDKAADGGPRLCFGTVVNSGFPKRGPRKKFMHRRVEFDEDDAAVYGPNERGNAEDLEYHELMDAFELYKEKEEDDHKKPSAN